MSASPDPLGPSDDIAVIGLSCRLPGAKDPSAFWRLLSAGETAVTETPDERWDTSSLRASDSVRPDGISSRRGGFLEDVGHFDAEFFGISPREAAAMDPQQRLMLELGWEALENAGVVPGTLRGAHVGVFAGAIGADYATLSGQQGPEGVDHHTMAGLSRGLIANRVSYALGLRGPSFVVDSAQSSSLVAVHLACESLRSGESELALAGGVHLNVAPDSTLAASKFGGLSPDGRCHTFDERANGYVRGEGGGLVVLKPLRKALADGDTVHCVIRGSAVNNDGASDGLTTPDASAQESVLRTAYERAGVEPSRVQYVELHGTGTKVGDPIEAAALGAVTAPGRADDAPLAVGSAKTNVGHLEGAAGITGLLKAVLAIRYGQLPPSLNFERPNPRIPFAELGLRVQTELADWGHPAHERLAGVSSFGMGGVNCHVVLAGAPRTTPPPAAEVPAAPAAAGEVPVPYVLSATSAAAVRGQAARLHEFLTRQSGVDPVGAASPLLSSRTLFDHRAVVLAPDRDALLADLDRMARGVPSAGAVVGRADSSRDTRHVFVFPGQGAQWAGMGRELLASSPVFADCVARCERALGAHVDWSLHDVLRSGEGLERVDIVQPVSWAVMVSLAAMWEAAGVSPDAVVGHSQGEIAAAVVAGALSLEDAAKVVVLRSRLISGRLSGKGAMTSVGLPADEVRARIESHPGVSVAVVNGPRSTVLSGDPEVLGVLEAEWERTGTKVRRIAVDYASHSPHVDLLRDELLGGLADIAPVAGRVPLMSTVECAWLDGSTLDAAYWVRNLREPVRFSAAVRELLAAGHTNFVECSSHPVLTAAVADIADEAAVPDVFTTGSLRRDDGGLERFLTCLAETYVRGAPVRWAEFLPAGVEPLPAHELPTYAFQRRRHWITAGPAGPGGPAPAAAAPQEHGAGPERQETDTKVSALELVRAQAALVLRTDPADVRVDRSFKAQGFDSVMAVELRNRLNAATELTLPSGVVFDHPTPERLAGEIAARRGAGGASAAVAEAVRAPAAGGEDDPVVIVGMSCRFPGGVRSPEDLWRLVRDAGEALGDYPDDRHWDVLDPLAGSPAGERGPRKGAFLYDAAGFDAEFFGISPREALAMDPQQRLLLEASWEALEAAGIVPDTLRGSRTGVFAGAMAGDYGTRLHEGPDHVAGHLLTGLATSVVSGRVAYCLGLEGPALTVDTACSSSLVALHLAAQALRQGDCSLALAAGVTVMSTPGMFTEFGRQRALAADGRCKAFSEAADGTGWAEGVGVLVVERLSDARRNGHRVLAVLRGSAVNQDGASNGLTAPNGPSQQRVIRQALADAGLSAAEVDAVEAHGTGTALGDPIEAQALLETYGQGRDAGHPLWLGSLKSNIGHTQAAAGVAGVIKMVMALRHGVLPRTLHVREPSRKVDWSAGAVALLTRAQPWPEAERARRAAVSSFGISGTNAHVIIEQAPSDEPACDLGAQPPTAARAALPWVISGKSPAAVAAQAERLRAFVAARPGLRPSDIAYSLATTRTAFPHRAVVAGRGHEELLSGLEALADGRSAPGVGEGRVLPDGGLAFMFTGQGAQRLGMGQELHAAYPVFAAAFDAVVDELDNHLDRSLREVVWGTDRELLDRTVYTQAALFAVEVALYRLLEAWGIRPDYVTGHSVGELAAAHVAGVLSLPDAALLVAERGRLMQRLPAAGAMVAVQAREEELLPYLGDRVGIAAVNGPESVVLSGDEEAVLALAAEWARRGRRTRRLAVSHAFHSPLMEPMLERFRAVAESLTYAAPDIPLVSNLTGREASARELGDAGHWVAHVRDTVRFADGVRHLRERGVTRFLELGPDGVLSVMAQGCLDDTDRLIVPVLRRDRPERTALALAVGQLHASGTEIDWTACFAGTGARVVELPTYAFQHERYWLEPPAGEADLASAGLVPVGHPLLAAAVQVDDGAVLTGRFCTRRLPWLADHRVGGAVVVPGTALLETAARAAAQTGHGGVAELLLHTPLVVPDGGAADVQVRIEATDTPGVSALRLLARCAATDEWTTHATGTLGGEPAAGPEGAEALTAWPPAGAVALDVAHYYDDLAARGLTYGPAFRGVRAVWRAEDELFAEVRLPDAGAARCGAYLLHPALLDAVLHPLAAGELLPDEQGARLPFSWSGVRHHAPGAPALRVRMRREGSDTVHLTAWDTQGAPVAEAGVVLRPVSAAKLRSAVSAGRQEPLYRMVWGPPGAAASGGRTPSAQRCLVVGDGPVAEAVLGHLAGTATVTDRVGGFAGTAPERVRAGLAAVLERVQSWLAGPRPEDECLVVITRQACPAGTDAAVDPLHAAVWGLVRTVQTEHPGLVRLVDVDGTQGVPEGLSAAVGATAPQLAVRGGELLVPRLEHVEASAGAPRGDAGVERANASVLVTGAGGVVGSALTRHVVATRGIGHVVLVSRRGAAGPGVAELADDIREMGATVTVAACDAADREQVAAVLADLPATHPLRGVIHAAGTLADTIFDSLTVDRLNAVLDAKVDAVHVLDAATRDLELDWFVACSSVAGWWGTAGQANYAAANACVDALIENRHRAGHPALSLAWGLWEDRSELSGHLSDVDIRRMARVGIEPLSTADALRAFDRALARPEPVLAPVRLGAAGLQGAVPGSLPPFLATPAAGAHVPARTQAAQVRSTRPVAAPAGPSPTAPPASGEQRRQALTDLVRTGTAAVLGRQDLREDQLDAAFSELGVDSLMALELREHLNNATGLRLPPTLLFDHPTLPSLTDHLVRTLGGEEEPEEPAAARVPRAEAATAEEDDPIVIVGMACRYPGGVESPDDLWDLVASGSDGVTPFPTDRGWDFETLFADDPDLPGTSHARTGGFLHDAAWFDAKFFGVSPREALATDPQQRLLLETSWEALEHAGINPQTLKGSPTGVFAGIMYHDYGSRLHETPDGMEGYLINGSLGSVASGRVSYVMGFEGPAVTVDTACSSSLVALHLAGQALRREECTLALVGGVTVMSVPSTFVDFSRQRALAPDGRCKAFSSDANGTGWAEGVGVLVVERLSEARRNGHRIMAVVRGSAVNQDGSSNGLTAPSGAAQQRVIRRALADAALSPEDIDVVEAHGTGTALGDPIEAQALLSTYGRDRERPLWLGTLKSNIGHSQAAAGVGGIIKTVMAMQHGVMPRTLHVGEPTPHVDWSSGAVRLLTEEREWPAEHGPRRAAVSSFGISGTNAHVILEHPADTAPADPAPKAPATSVLPWVLSGTTRDALAAQAARLLDFADGRSEADDHAVAATLASGRAVFRHRAVVLGAGHEELLSGLSAAARGDRHPHAVLPDDTREAGKTAFLFSGQGSQRPAMGRELYRAFPAYAEAFDAVSAALEVHLDRRLSDVVFADADDAEAAALLNRTEYAQPCLFALQVALFRLITSWGVRPAYLAGHSVGEIAAAHVAGVLSLPDAAELVTARGRLMQELPGGGAMVAVQAPEDEVRALLAGHDAVGVAAVNGPAATVVSGDSGQVADIVGQLERRGRRTRALRVSHAFHSPLMEPMLDGFRAVVSRIDFGVPRIPLVSTLTGAPAGTGDLTSAEYWVAHVREPVRFHDGVRALEAQGVRTLVELGPDGTLSALAAGCLREPSTATLVPALRKDRPEDRALLEAVARLFVQGAPVQWSSVLGEATGAQPPLQLPTYAFQRERYWLDPSPAPAARRAADLPGELGHPILGTAIHLAGGAVALTGRLSTADATWLPDHQVGDAVVAPSTAILEMLAAAGRQAGAPRVAELVLRAPMVIPPEGDLDVQLFVSPSDGQGLRDVSVHSRPAAAGDDVPWIDNATARLTTQENGTAPEAGPMPAWPPAGTRSLDLEGALADLAWQGLRYGPAFRGAGAVLGGDGEVFAEVELPEDVRREAHTYLLHPALLDAALHPLAVPGVLPDAEGLRLPFSWTGVEIHRHGAARLRVRLVRTGDDTVAFTAWDPDGNPVMTAEGLTLRVMGPDELRALRSTPQQCLYEVTWAPVPAAPRTADGPAHRYLVLAGDAEADTVATRIARDSRDVRVLRCLDGDAPVPARVRAALAAVLTETQAWLAEERDPRERLVVVTRDAVMTDGQSRGADPAQAAVWGLLRTAQTEHPGRLLLADVDADPASADGLTALLADDEPQIALRAGEAYVPRLVTVADAPGQATAGALAATPGTDWATASLLVTGAGGVVGSALARHAVRAHGVGHVVLLSRRGERAPGMAELADELRGLGATVSVEAGDVGDRGRLARVLSDIPADRPLRGVVHAAGTTRDGTFRHLVWEGVEHLLPSKVDAVHHLDELTRHLPLDWFVVCSSAAGWWGSAGQANYAASNACVDAIVQRRRAAGHAGLSLAWGLWEDRSELSGHLDSGDLRRLARLGIAPLATADALTAFDTALEADNPVLLPLRLDTRNLSDTEASPLTPLLRDHLRRTAEAAKPSGRAEAVRPLGELLAPLDEDGRAKLLESVVAEEVAAVLGFTTTEDVEADRNFFEIGFDSLTALELRNRVEKLMGQPLAATVVFDHPTADALARYLHTQIAVPAETPRPAVSVVERVHEAPAVPEPVLPLKGRTVLLTGATGALGQLFATAMAEAGANLVVTGRDVGTLDRLAHELREQRAEVLALPTDLSDRDAMPRLLAAVGERFDAVDVLVNNAGVTGPAGPLWETDDDAWWHAMEVNLRGSTRACRAVLPGMIEQRGGRVINVVSSAGKHRWPLVSGYSVSKAALIKLGENLAPELEGTGVTVFSYHPGLVDLGITQRQIEGGVTGERWSDEVRAWLLAQRENRRLVDPGRSARMLVRLAAGEADPLSGQYLTVDDDIATLLRTRRPGR
ncbi:polyketide synthase [Streptomyces minutiscleroticus]|uniref:Polyketide synthase n=1 Tax=Streptomyces minutiscleroticus TaxID=68238 RepID=A0A918NX67_9ACTN|nr:type I polyketide synthase [Streptomyces minutiscleroticus]GGY03053.1 polyketide synthase [Streptomyces minutiscleroticus]